MEEFTSISNDRGLYKKTLREGRGVSPGDNAKVKISYTGCNINGDKIDQSEEDGFIFHVTEPNVLTGFQVGVKTMREGEIAVFIFREDYAFGDEEYDNIPPNSTLIYKVELLDIVAN